MGISVDNILQMNSGTFEGSSGTITLSSATTAGSLVVAVVAAGGETSTSYTLNAPVNQQNSSIMSNLGTGQVSPTRANTAIYGSERVASGLTSWTLSTLDGLSKLVAWAIFEIEGVGVDPTSAVNAQYWYARDSVSGTAAAATSLVSSATTKTVPHTNSGRSECFQSLGLQSIAATSADTTVPVISGYDSEYYELVQINISNASVAFTMSVAAGQYNESSNFNASLSVSPNSYVSTDLVLLFPDDIPRVPKYYLIFGAEIGTITNASNWTFPAGTPLGIPALRGVVGSPEIVSNIKRSGNYSLKLASTSAAESVTLLTSADGNHRIMPLRFNVYFDSSLPGVDVELASFETTSLANGMKVVYRTASQKIGITVDSGTEVLSDAVVSANKWIGIDLRFYSGSDATHRCLWQVDYDSLDSGASAVPQTMAVGTLSSSNSITLVRLGWTTSITATVYYDDVVLSTSFGTYPIGDVRIVPLKVDPAGTPSVSGSSSNFRTFTSNGTLATWTAAATRTALDDIPPTIGASADGLTQVSVATNDYVDIPIETLTLAPLNSPRALRIYWAGWAASGNPATCKMIVVDTNSEEVYRATDIDGFTLDYDFDDNNLKWITGMLNYSYAGLANKWYEVTQAKIDGLSVRWGYSGDATPDVGLQAVFFELAYQPATVIGVMSGEEGAFMVYARQDPASAAIASYLCTTPTGTRGMTVNFTINGSDSSQYVNPNTTYEKVIGASSVTEVTSVGMVVDPTE